MKTLIKKIATDQIFKYLVAGVSATIVFFIVKMVVFNLTNSGVISEIMAQVISILFAFFTNKLWVFEKTTNPFLHEFIKFIASRLFVLLISIVANWYLVDTHPQILTGLLHLSLKPSVFVLTLFLQVLTIILNYVFSKFLIFTTK